MAKFKVVRPHQGDKFYNSGDVRTAPQSDVVHLIKQGVLEPYTEEAADNVSDEPPATNNAEGDSQKADEPVATKVEPAGKAKATEA